MRLAIKGHPTRGKEVIELLEMLGGKNPYNYRGNYTKYYLIAKDNSIYLLDYLPKDVVAYTLEEFEELYPYKVGDKVIVRGYKEQGEDEITSMIITYDNDVKYKTKNHRDTRYFTADSLNPTENTATIKEETMEESVNISFFEGNAQSCDIMNDIIKKINIAELLKDCPKGMELDCPMFENLEFVRIDEYNKPYPIICRVKTEFGSYNVHTFTEHGSYGTEMYSKCVIFPKGKTTWEGFVPPCKFKDGDVIAVTMTPEGIWIGIFKQYNEPSFESHCCLSTTGTFRSKGFKNHSLIGIRFATEEEKKKLFDAIKNNGYKWNAEAKTLEKLAEPKFKVGDKIKHKTYISKGVVVTEIKDTHYILDDESALPFTFQDEYDLVPNKFDINTLKPFESKVLVRSSMDGLWKPAVFGFRNGYNDNAFYIVGGSCWKQCIPYLNNEHLCGTTNDCDEYFKTW